VTTRRIYAGKDFEGLVSEATARLRKQFPDISLEEANELSRFLIELVATSAENIAFFLDLQANEGFMRTAQLRNSVAEIAAFNGYNPVGAVPGSGDISINITTPVNRVVRIPRLQQFNASNGLIYETNEEYIFPANDTSVRSITLSQLETRFANFTSNASRFQRFNLAGVQDGESLGYRLSSVRVDGVLWSEVDQFELESGDVYRVSYLSQPPYIEFGDGAVGNVPDDGAEIRVEFRVTRGLAGNLQDVGQVTALATPVTAGGQEVDFTIDPTTGRIVGGDDIEDIKQIKTKIPLFQHADGAVVTKPDVEGTLSLYRDPLFGSVAQATAFIVTAIENDIQSLNLINTARGQFSDATAIVTPIIAALGDIDTGIAAVQTDVQTLTAELSDLLVGVATSIINETADARANKAAIDTASNTVDLDASSISVFSGQASATASTLASTINAIPIGAGDQLTAGTRDGLIDAVNAILGNLSSIDSRKVSIDNQVAIIRASAADLLTQLDNIDTLANAADQRRISVDAIMTGNLETQRLAVVTQQSALQTDLVDPWTVTVGTLDALETHLDDVFSDPCGPNLVSVPILAFDADGFYIAPSNGLLFGFEDFLNNRNEPSVVFSVVSGETLLITPQITIAFAALTGYSPTNLKALIESAILDFVKGGEFGQDLFLDDLYNATRNIEGVASINLEITGFTGGSPSDATVDTDGNLVLEDRAIIARPSLSFFLRTGNTREAI
jgi:hypothetical protein